jgi:hypothetical protein
MDKQKIIDATVEAIFRRLELCTLARTAILKTDIADEVATCVEACFAAKPKLFRVNPHKTISDAIKSFGGGGGGGGGGNGSLGSIELSEDQVLLGKTALKMNQSPFGAYYVHPSYTYANSLALRIGRHDLIIIGKSSFLGGRSVEYDSTIVFDPAIEKTQEITELARKCRYVIW